MDLFSTARRVEDALVFETAPLKVAIMGCVGKRAGLKQKRPMWESPEVTDSASCSKKGKVIKKSARGNQMVEALLKEIEILKREA